MLVAELIVGLLEMIEVDQKQRERRRVPIGTGEGHVEATPKLAYVRKPGEAVGDRLLAAAMESQRVRQRHGGAAGESGDGEELLVGERRVGPGQVDQRSDAVTRGDGDGEALLIVGDRRFA